MSTKKLTHRATLSAIVLFAAPAMLLANEVESDSIYPQQELDEVVVTQYKTNRHNLTPASVSLIGRAQIQAQQLTDITNISGMLPNFFIADYGSRQTTPIAIRGVMSKNKGTAVGFYVDGMPHFEISAFNTDMLDVKAIEIYRGPQGTLYGRNTIGGVISVHTPTPFEYQGTKLRLGYGNYNNATAQISNYTRFSDRFGMNIGGYYQHNGGYFKNTFLNKKADKADLAGGKVGFYYNLTDKWKLRLNSSLDFVNQGGYPYAPFDTEQQKVGEVAYNRECGYKRIISNNGLMFNYAGEGFYFNSQTTYQHIHDNMRLDQDFSADDNFFVNFKLNQNSWNQEFTVKSDNEQRFQWIAGVNAFVQENDNYAEASYFKRDNSQPTTYDISTQGAAAFAQGSYNLWQGLSATAGLRFDYEHSKMNYNRESLKLSDGTMKHVKDFISSLNFTQLIPKFGLQYKFNHRNQLFGNITRGYKAGAFNQTFQSDDERSYDPEYNWNYEIGAKLGTLDNRLGGELTLFYIDWRNQHISRFVPAVGNVITNAGHSDSKGVEVSLIGRPVEGLVLQANYGYTYARFLDYKKDEKTDYSGKMIPMVPRHTLSVNGQYTIRPTRTFDLIRLSTNLTGVGKLYWLENNEQVQNFYALLGAKIAVQKGPVTVELWGKNLTNTKYLSYYFVSTAKTAQQGTPLTFGANITFDL